MTEYPIVDGVINDKIRNSSLLNGLKDTRIDKNGKPVDPATYGHTIGEAKWGATKEQFDDAIKTVSGNMHKALEDKYPGKNENDIPAKDIADAANELLRKNGITTNPITEKMILDERAKNKIPEPTPSKNTPSEPPVNKEADANKGAEAGTAYDYPTTLRKGVLWNTVVIDVPLTKEQAEDVKRLTEGTPAQRMQGTTGIEKQPDGSYRIVLSERQAERHRIDIGNAFIDLGINTASPPTTPEMREKSPAQQNNKKELQSLDGVIEKYPALKDIIADAKLKAEQDPGYSNLGVFQRELEESLSKIPVKERKEMLKDLGEIQYGLTSQSAVEQALVNSIRRETGIEKLIKEATMVEQKPKTSQPERQVAEASKNPAVNYYETIRAALVDVIGPELVATIEKFAVGTNGSSISNDTRVASRQGPDASKAGPDGRGAA